MDLAKMIINDFHVECVAGLPGKPADPITHPLYPSRLASGAFGQNILDTEERSEYAASQNSFH